VTKNVRTGAIVLASLAVAAGGAVAVRATAATGSSSAASTTYPASAALKAKAGTGRGTFSGKLSSTNGTSGALAWKVTFSGLSGPATGVQLRLGSTVLSHLCTVCRAGVLKTTALRGVAVKAVYNSKATVTVSTKLHATGELAGLLKVTRPSTGGGGGGVVVVTPAAIAAGKKYAAQYSCNGCHTINGTKSTGPTWKGLYNSKVRQTDGTTVTADDAYLIRVITDASTLKVQGYDSGVMSEVIPPGTVSNAQARAIVAYIKSLK